MEPLDYLKILQRHWKIAVALVATVMVVVFVLSPSRPATVYEAKHSLLRQSSSTAGTAAAGQPEHRRAVDLERRRAPAGRRGAGPHRPRRTS